MNNSPDSVTLALLGDGSVGKSSIISSFQSDGFVKIYRQTIGCDFYEKDIHLSGDVHLALRVWDIGGQSIHSKSLTQYIKNTSAIFLVYDVTNKASFDNLDDWLLNIRSLSSCGLIYLIGNKSDLINLRQVTQNQHEQFIHDNNLCGGMFLSAKTGENVVKSFYSIAAEAKGIHLSKYELSFHDKVLPAYVVPTSEDEGRTLFADEIEKEDMELEKRKTQQSVSFGCGCTIC